MQGLGGGGGGGGAGVWEVAQGSINAHAEVWYMYVTGT